MNDARIAVIYYSSTGNIHRLAEAYAKGAADAGAEVRLRKVPELASDAVVDGVPRWRAHLDATEHIASATHDDLTWATGYAFGTPTRFGNISSQLKQFFDTTSPLWLAGEMANKPVTGFTGSQDPHGGQESTLLALYQTMYHWGSVVLPPGWVDYEIAHAAGGNPYGISQVETQAHDSEYVAAVLAAARHQGGRLAETARALAHLNAAQASAA
ncbi:NAD(P)H:quinone oxidoreductase [Actinomadura sp. 9N215]|uniref:NAD(P)H:quinone oxidoreductase n=1 Tax=Actinomadura sp. 9N215 TaxID=3375150 RepID=UPI00379DB875